MKQSRIFSPSRIFRAVGKVFERTNEDKLNLYAAQASFFIVIASIPFLMMLLALLRSLFPDVIESVFEEIGKLLPERFTGIYDTVYSEIAQKASISMISIYALTSFWSSSRGIAAVTRGVAGVYGTREHTGFFAEIFRAFFHTVAFIILIIGALIIMVFGASIRDFIVERFPASMSVFDLIFKLRSFTFFIILTLFFALIFLAVARNGKRRDRTEEVFPSRFKSQLPGAAFAAAGWMLFSYFFSLYIEYFPSASYIYGSLATIVLIMLWLYFCMIILLAGAEVNKLLYLKRK